MSAGYPIYRAKGKPGELGAGHGRLARDRIRAHLDFLAESLGLSSGALRERATRFKPLFERYCPHLAEEIQGLADGAGIDPADALAVNLRGELAGVSDGGCTTFAVGPKGTASGECLIGQNADLPAEMSAFAYVLCLQPTDGPAILMWTFGGMIGYHGVNRAGLGQFTNALGGGPAWRFALSHYPLKRMMLECTTTQQVADLCDRVPVCSSGNYVLCDAGQNLLDIEITPEGTHRMGDEGKGYIAHTNHFLCGPHACSDNYDKSLPDSFPRLERICALIESSFGTITVESMAEALRDHSTPPATICRHPHDGYGDAGLPNTGRTAASLIAEPARGLLHVSFTNPCENPYVTYGFE